MTSKNEGINHSVQPSRDGTPNTEYEEGMPPPGMGKHMKMIGQLVQEDDEAQTHVNEASNDAQESEIKGQSTAHDEDNGRDVSVSIHQPMKTLKIRTKNIHRGIIVSFYDKSGFVKCTTYHKKIFFHLDTLDEKSKSVLKKQSAANTSQEQSEDAILSAQERNLKVGDELELELNPDGRVGRPVVIRTTLLPFGTVDRISLLSPREPTGKSSPRKSLRLEGRIKRVDEDNLYWVSTVMKRNGREKYYTFSEEDILYRGKESSNGKKRAFAIGQSVEFYEVAGGSFEIPRATRVKLLETDTKKDVNLFHIGMIVTMRESYGFILDLNTSSQLFFHFSEFLGQKVKAHSAPPDLQVGAYVRFTVSNNPATGKDIGKSVCLISEKRCPTWSLNASDDRLKGIVIKKPSDIALPVDIGDGLIEFETTDSSGEPTRERAMLSFGEICNSHVPINEKDIVEFDCYGSDMVQLHLAKNVTLWKKEGDDFDGREYGVIYLLKNNFGFINCADRQADLFFHFSNIDAEPESLKIGLDVEFSMERAPNGRVHAVDIVLAEVGSAIFEEISKTTYTGVVKEKLKLAKPESNGVIEGVVDGKKQTFVYSLMDLEDKSLNPRLNDRITFQVLTDLKREKAAEQAGRPGLGKRASNVTIIRQVGKIGALKPAFGFIEYEPASVAADGKTVPKGNVQDTTQKEDKDKKEGGNGHEKEEPVGNAKQRIFFHRSEVLEGIDLAMGDSVEFVEVLNPKTSELNARKILLLGQSGHRQTRDIKERPEHLKFGGGKGLGGKAAVTMKLAKGPDGTRGFSKEYQMSRGVVFEENNQLNIKAAPFIPAKLQEK